MPRPKQEPLDLKKLQGFKDFRLIDDLLVRLHSHGTQRDKAHNRDLFCDQYATLFLLDFFNPTVTSLCGLRQFTTLEKSRSCVASNPPPAAPSVRPPVSLTPPS